MRLFCWLIACVAPYFAFIPWSTFAQRNLDVNRDGKVKIACFGDSLTRGSGSSTGGYPARLSRLLRVAVSNYGVSGHKSFQLTPRLRTIKGRSYDKAVVMIGTNDARGKANHTRFRLFLQKALNTTYFYKAEPVLMTAPPTCCAKRSVFNEVRRINKITREIAKQNKLRLVDNEKIFLSTCRDVEKCPLIATDGLHLTDLGYRVVAESVAAVLLGLDPLDRNIQVKLARKLGLKQKDILLGSKL